MKILHIMLGCFYIDNHSYQENMLPKYHREMGLDVEIVASTLSFDENGDACHVAAGSYINEYGISVTRLPYKKNILPVLQNRMGKFFRIYEGFAQILEKSAPDVLFVHGCQFCDIKILVRYVKTHNVTVYVDNHADFSNSARNWISKHILHGILWKKCAHQIEPYTTKFYGVLPARVDFLRDVYRLPTEKIELLVMGADDEMVQRVTHEDDRLQFRQQYQIDRSDFVIVTGGKIDHAKKQVLTMLKELQPYLKPGLRVIVFGSIVEDMREELMQYVDGHMVQFIGWLNNEQTARCIAACDLAAFPGRHSVLWEETVGLGVPLVVKEWHGTKHIDVGGNAIFVENDEMFVDALVKIMNHPDLYEKMKCISMEQGMRTFSYRDIAARSISEVV